LRVASCDRRLAEVITGIRSVHDAGHAARRRSRSVTGSSTRRWPAWLGLGRKLSRCTPYSTSSSPLHTRVTHPHFTPESRTYSVPLFLKQRCDRALQCTGVVAAGAPSHRFHASDVINPGQVSRSPRLCASHMSDTALYIPLVVLRTKSTGRRQSDFNVRPRLLDLLHSHCAARRPGNPHDWPSDPQIGPVV
jgi:hypothetical protein